MFHGEIYIDETKLSPDALIHEYTHLWDTALRTANNALWQRGKELMRQTGLWKEIAESEHYGKKWQAQGKTAEEIDDLTASEVHSRLVGGEGERLLMEEAKKKGKGGLITRLRAWIREAWRSLAESFGVWTAEDMDKLTLNDFTNMTLRDLAEGVDPNEIARDAALRQALGIAAGMVDISKVDTGAFTKNERLAVRDAREALDGMRERHDQGYLTDDEFKRAAEPYRVRVAEIAKRHLRQEQQERPVQAAPPASAKRQEQAVQPHEQQPTQPTQMSLFDALETTEQQAQEQPAEQQPSYYPAEADTAQLRRLYDQFTESQKAALNSIRSVNFRRRVLTNLQARVKFVHLPDGNARPEDIDTMIAAVGKQYRKTLI